MRVAFFGSSRFSCLVFASLLASRHRPVCVVTQPDQPAGRRLTLCQTAVCGEAQAAGLPVLKPERLRNNAEFRRELSALAPEAFITASYGQLIPPKVLGLTEWPLNVHPSLLPHLRGASPIRTALLQRLPVTGCCVMRMTPRLDDGDVLLRAELAVAPEWNHEQLVNELGMLGGLLAVEALDRVETSTAVLTPQDHSQATYCGIYSRDDTWIDWARPAEELAAFVRAWDPDQGALCALPGARRIKLWRAEAAAPPSGVAVLAGAPPGMVAAVSKRALWVATGQGLLRLDELQPENKPRMTTASFLAGYRLEPGMLLGGR